MNIQATIWMTGLIYTMLGVAYNLCTDKPHKVVWASLVDALGATGAISTSVYINT